MDTVVPSLDEIRGQYEQGQYIKAYQLAIQRGPLNAWKEPDAQILAGRLAGNLGAHRLAAALHIRAWRQAPQNPEVVYYYARTLAWRRGGLAARFFLDQQPDRSNGDAIHRADMHALRAAVASELRDFDEAERFLRLAKEAAPEHPWIYVEDASVLEAQDRYAEALEAAEIALAITPWFRPAVQSKGHLLVLLGRDADAMEFLSQASQRLESFAVVAQLAELQRELGLHEAAHRSILRVEELSPLRDRLFNIWLKSQHCDTAYYTGDFTKARELAGQIDVPYYKLLTQNLDKSAADARRVLLDVPFVRQHQVTCAPATLSAISRYWSMPADHLSLAEEICYDGTPYASERGWGESHGYIVRDFTVTFDAIVALIDRGIPCTLATVELTNAHLQAIIGYDSRKRVLLVRDPYLREIREFLVDQTLERFAHSGPRASAFVPAGEAGRLEGIVLPDAPLWDQYYQAIVALNEHRRDGAMKWCQAMAEAAPDHRLSIEARLAVACYDGDTAAELECYDRLLELHKDSAFWALRKASCLRRMGRSSDYAKIIHEQAAKHDADPVFLLQRAQLYREDARQWPRALAEARRVVRILRGDAGAYHVLASVMWDHRRFDDAMLVYRASACVGDKQEQAADSYFRASRYFRREPQAIEFLESRFKRFGKKSSEPARTLFWALDDVGRNVDAFAVLEEAQKLRPDDGDLMLFAAEMHARRGRSSMASDLLKAAKGKCRRAAWLRSAASLAGTWGKLDQSLQLWRKVLEQEPLAVDAHQMTAVRLEQLHGRAAAIEHLNEALERFPHHVALHEMHVEWVRQEDPQRCEAALRRLIELHPHHAWAYRELALMLSEQRRFGEAEALMGTARDLEPTSPAFFNVMGELRAAAGDHASARESYREAIRLDIDNALAHRRLIALGENPTQRRQDIQFIRGELMSRVTMGDGILAFQEQARNALEPTELLALMREAHASRPELWHSWSALGQQLMAMGRLEEGIRLLREAAQRFPLMPPVWLDLAEGCRLALDREGEVEALRRALMARSDFIVPLQRLADVHQREGNLEEAARLLERGIARVPTDAALHGTLAEVLWKMNRREEAVTRIEKAIDLMPVYLWAWGRLDDWCRQLHRSARVQELARELTQRRPGDPQVWLMLADALYEPAMMPQRLEAIEKALALAPRSLEAHLRKVAALAEARRFDDARAACRPAEFGDNPPINLRGRAAWIEAVRGDLPQAIDLMRQAVADDPTYAWGWSQLVEWCDQVKDHEGMVNAARHLVEVSPNDPHPLTLLGNALLRTTRPVDRREAAASFKRAFALAPDFDLAGDGLFDMQLVDEDWAAAGKTLERRKPHLPAGVYLAHRVVLAARKKDNADALAALKQLVVTPADRFLIDLAAGNMDRAGWGEQIDGVITAVVDHPDANPHALAAMLNSHASERKWRECEDVLRRLQDRPEAFTLGAVAVLEMAGERGAGHIIRSLLDDHGPRIAADTRSWAAAGYGLSRLREAEDCVQWMSDWPQREGVVAWMLLNLVDALRQLRRFRDAEAVSLAALELPPDNSQALHEVWLAFELALRGSDEAGALLRMAEPESLHIFFALTYRLADLVRRAGPAPLNSSTFRMVKTEMSALATEATWLKTEPVFRDTFLRAVQRLADLRGGLLARWWAMRWRQRLKG